MADLTGKAISELPAASTLNDDDMFALSQGGASKRLSVLTLRNKLASFGENILDNWYFGGGVDNINACINQRGASSYASTTIVPELAIDRWRITNGQVNVYSTALRVRLGNGYNGFGRFTQLIDARVPAGTYTASAYVRVDQAAVNVLVGVSEFGSFTLSGTTTINATTSGYVLVQKTFTLSEAKSNLWFEIAANTGSEQGADVYVIAVKLERGESSTLGYNTTSGGVLTDFEFDPTVELSKCERYFLPLFNSATGDTGNGVLLHAINDTIAQAVIPLPISMRKGTITRSGATINLPEARWANLFLRLGTVNTAVTSVTANWRPCGVHLDVRATGLTPGTTYILYAENGYLNLLSDQV